MKDQFDLKKFLIENKLTNLSLREEDNDWDIEVGEDWNVKDLTVGDEITYDMFQKDKDYFDLFFEGGKNFVITDYDNDGHEDFIRIKYTKNGFTTSTLVYVDVVNDKILKPQYQIVPTLNEQQDDEWDIATDAFDVQELTVGDKITPNMWDKKAVIDAGEEDEFLNDEIWTINDIRNGWGVDMTSNGGGSIGWNIDDVQALLKPQYKIVAP